MGNVTKKMRDYGFVSAERDDRLVCTEDAKKGFCILGKTDYQGVEKLVITSWVEEMKAGVARTFSGSLYELEEMNEDYREFLTALKNEIPVLTEWNIINYYDEGYMISGKLDGSFFAGLIIEQKGNYLIVERHKGKKVKIFVDWLSMAVNTRIAFNFSGEAVPGLRYSSENYEKFVGRNIRPKLFK